MLLLLACLLKFDYLTSLFRFFPEVFLNPEEQQITVFFPTKLNLVIFSCKNYIAIAVPVLILYTIYTYIYIFFNMQTRKKKYIYENNTTTRFAKFFFFFFISQSNREYKKRKLNRIVVGLHRFRHPSHVFFHFIFHD